MLVKLCLHLVIILYNFKPPSHDNLADLINDQSVVSIKWIRDFYGETN